MTSIPFLPPSWSDQILSMLSTILHQWTFGLPVVVFGFVVLGWALWNPKAWLPSFQPRPEFHPSHADPVSWAYDSLRSEHITPVVRRYVVQTRQRVMRRLGVDLTDRLSAARKYRRLGVAFPDRVKNLGYQLDRAEKLAIRIDLERAVPPVWLRKRHERRLTRARAQLVDALEQAQQELRASLGGGAG